MMKTLLLALGIMLTSFQLQAQESGFDDKLPIRLKPGENIQRRFDNPVSSDTLTIRFEVSRERRRLFTKIPLPVFYGFRKNSPPGGDRVPGNKPHGFGFVLPVTLLQSVFHRSKVALTAEIRQFDSTGKLMLFRSIPVTDRNHRKRVTSTFRIAPGQYLDAEFENIGKTPAMINAKIDFSNQTDSTSTDDGPTTDSDAPILWDDYDGGVFIDGMGMFANDSFMATYEANFGPSATWIAVGEDSGGDGGGGSSGGGSSPYEPPSAEAKKMARDLKALQANKCEAQYILDHAISDPMILPKLITVRTYVSSYLSQHNMEAANQSGTSKENAFKHALYNALAYCEIGEQHAVAMAALHETCNGVNQNASEAERTMDQYNNAQGFNIAANVGCSNTNNLVAAIENAYANGTLHDINGNPTKK